MRKLFKLLKEARGNALWDFAKWLYRNATWIVALMTALLAGVVGWIRQLPLPILIVLVLGVGVVAYFLIRTIALYIDKNKEQSASAIQPSVQPAQRIATDPATYAPGNTDQKVEKWIEARFPRRVVVMDDRYHFGFDVQVPQSHLRVMIRRIKNRPEYITILNRIAMTDEQRTKLKGMSDQARESLLKTINLEASRSKIEPHFDQYFRYVCLHHDILITPELTESRLMDGINDVKFSHSVIHHTINNLLKPPA